MTLPETSAEPATLLGADAALLAPPLGAAEPEPEAALVQIGRPRLRPAEAGDAARLYEQAVGALPTGVSVVTAIGREGPVGCTVNTVVPVSREPLLVLVCLPAGAPALRVLLDSDSFAVNVLRDAQAQVADDFARTVPDWARFESVSYRLRQGVPVLEDALSWLTCGVAETWPAGDHTVVLGAVTGMHAGPGEPLVWQSGEYRTLEPGLPFPAA